MELYFDKDQKPRLLTTPFVSSWLPQAHSGDLFSQDFEVRKAAWAGWAVESLVGVSGHREYSALALPGKFYDPKGSGELKARPHLEIPTSKLSSDDVDFPTKLAMAGNGVLFPWWLYQEVVAAKRVMFSVSAGSLDGFRELVVPRSESLRHGLQLLRDACRPQWSTVEELLVTSDGLVADACGDFSTAEIEKYLPGAAQLKLEVEFEPKLAEKSGVWAARRVGVWQLRGESSGVKFNTPVITPRLTANSTFADPLFDPAKEGLAALLVRALVLRRVAEKHLSVQPQVLNHRIGVPVPKLSARSRSGENGGRRSAHLRGIVSSVGEKTPEASASAAIAFLQVFPDAEDAWDLLCDWAGSEKILTVSRETFLNAHRKARMRVRRAEDPDRDDINLLLPLAWDEQGRVVRATFSKG